VRESTPVYADVTEPGNFTHSPTHPLTSTK
jgi:hypothetical protein